MKSSSSILFPFPFRPALCLATFAALFTSVLDGTAADPSQQAYLKAAYTQGNDIFGTAVAVSGDTLVVGVPWESSEATGVNGTPIHFNAPYSGAAYVYVRDGTNWIQQAYLKASNASESDQFGRSVAVSGDTVLVGAMNEQSRSTGINGNQNFCCAVGAGCCV